MRLRTTICAYVLGDHLPELVHMTLSRVLDGLETSLNGYQPEVPKSAARPLLLLPYLQ